MGSAKFSRYDVSDGDFWQGKDGEPVEHFVIDLEPWYEGICGQFWSDDQLYAYWTMMPTGAAGYRYGAQGIWNVGDGTILTHGGTQTYDEARQLRTPELLG